MQFLADWWLDEGRIAAVETLRPIAEDLDCSLAQLAIAWAAANPHVSTVLTGASRVEQVHENMGALAVLEKLTPEVKGRIRELLVGFVGPVQRKS